MVDHESRGKRDRARDELIQHVFERMFSLMKQIHREISFIEPSLSPTQARLLFIIARRDKGISVKELARVADITPGAITQFMDVLIMKNLVKREEDPDDRRIIRLKLTPSAIRQMEEFRKNFLGSAARKFDVLNSDELKALLNLLTKVSPEPVIEDKQL